MRRILFLGLFIFGPLFIYTVHCQVPALTIHKGLPCGGATAKGIFYGNGLYLAVFIAPTRLYTSPDADNWTLVAQGEVNRIGRPGFCFGGGQFVCVGDSGKIYTSSDGAVWTRRLSGTMVTLYDVEYLNGAYYSVGDNATLLHSPDGITWGQIITGIGNAEASYRGIVYGNGLFVINSREFPNLPLMLRSPDLTPGSWATNSLTVDTPNTVRFLKDHFYFFASEACFASTDGFEHALSVNIPLDAGSTLPTDGFADDERVYLVGEGASPDYVHTTIYTSPNDDYSFSSSYTVNIPATGGAWLDHHYFLYGDYGIQISGDSVNFQVLGSNYSSVATNGTGYVAVGNVYPAWANAQGEIGSSTDFFNWTNRSKVNNPNSIEPGVGPQTWVIYDGTKYRAGGFTSPDGITWTDTSAGVVNGTNAGSGSMAYGGGVYVAGNRTSLAWSHDGVNFTSTGPSGVTGYDIISVKYVNGRFFALGDDFFQTSPAVFVSPDGESWTDISPQLTQVINSINDVVYDGVNYYFMGSETDSLGAGNFFSMTMTDLNDRNSYGNIGGVVNPPAGADLGGSIMNFAYSNGHFIGGVTDMNDPGMGYLVYSTDGIHWNDSSLNYATTIGGVIATGDVFRLLGTNSMSILADFSGGPLPVSLLDFEAVASGSRSLLTWKTGEETNSSRFVVQRSVDGVRWDSIGVVAAAGNSAVTLDYRSVDGGPVAGYDDYRLALVDRDGGRQLSLIKRVFIGGEGAIRVYPNPAGGQVTVDLPGVEGVKVITLYDATGALVYRREMGGYTITLPLRGLPSGVYQLVIGGANGWQLRREVMHP